MAIFKTKAGLKITTRGFFVITGDIADGTISHGKRIIAGDVTHLYSKVIKTWEYVDHIGTGTFEIGLVIAAANEAEMEALLELDLLDKRIEIEE